MRSCQNDLTRHRGYSPARHVLGKAPRRPGSMLDDAEDMGALEAMTDETSPFWTRYRARTQRQGGFPTLGVVHDYQVGDLVVYRRDNVPGVSGTVWSTTSRVIGKESEHSMWVLNEGLPVLVSPHNVRPVDEIDVAAHVCSRDNQYYPIRCPDPSNDTWTSSSPDGAPVDQGPLGTGCQTPSYTCSRTSTYAKHGRAFKASYGTGARCC